MRLISIILGAGILTSCATSPVSKQSMLLETVRLDRQDGKPALKAGNHTIESKFVFVIGYTKAGSTLGPPTDVSWTVRLGDYCRDRPSWVESVVIGPAGETWRGYRVFVPAGPNRRQDWSSGADGADEYGGPSTPGLLDAVESGGRFVLALEDDAGHRHNAVVIDTLTPPQREALFLAAPLEDRFSQPVPLVAVPARDFEPSPAANRCPRP